MTGDRDVLVHLLPEHADPASLQDGIAVVIDVLRSGTSIIRALAAGCLSVRPCREIEEARTLANSMRAGRVLLAGERGGKPLPGFDLGNSPGEFSPCVCRGTDVVLTTSNGTSAIVRSQAAARTLIAGFINYSAICEQLRKDLRPVNMLCAGTEGEVAIEDALLAGGLVDYLCDLTEVKLNDSARLAWDCFENHGQSILGALEISKGGAKLRELGYDEDIRASAQVDQFNLVPELRRDPLRIEVGAVGIVESRWPR
jgi:2-phosphosulfolactate phosphatase